MITLVSTSFIIISSHRAVPYGRIQEDNAGSSLLSLCLSLSAPRAIWHLR